MLETEIKRLNENIQHLNSLLESFKPQEPITATFPLTTTPEAEDETQKASGYTTDDIKSMALAISRKDRSKQKDIKAKLAEHDAKIATDLTGDALQAVGEWLSALKEELGA